ncbi:MAG: hypothetical protein ABS36_15750 [Acidobacteria bacterium SCN 69-37]|nr:MAG: hypothetical protein ABS36_15750 [Acidobacteria bacterium SCN 69-37]
MNVSGRLRGWLIVGALAAVWLLVDRPWTVRPIRSAESAGPVEARQLVDEMWTSRVVATIEADAVGPAAFVEAARAGGARTGAVSASGIVRSVDTTSRVGLALVDVDPVDGRPDIAVQIGPVIRGTAVRDVLPFVRFTDFANQIEFAAVASALNDRVLSDVLADMAIEALPGRRVRVTGAASVDPADADALPVVTPVRLVLEAQP